MLYQEERNEIKSHLGKLEDLFFLAAQLQKLNKKKKSVLAEK